MRRGGIGVLLACALSGGLAMAQPAGDSPANMMRRTSAVLRAQWQARVAAGLAPAAVVEPSVTSARVLTPDIDVTKAPGLPTIELHVASGTVGLAVVSVGLSSPTGLHALQNFVPVPTLPPQRAHQTLAVQVGSPFSQNALGLYAERGAWTVSGITLISQDGQFISYGGPPAAALFPGGNVVNVANPNTPDVTPPGLAQGDLLTHTVSVSGPRPYVVARLPALDDISGVASESVGLSGPVGSSGFPAQIYLSSTLSRPVVTTGGLLYGALSATQTLGTYTITFVSVCDAASNCTYANSPAAIAAYFSHPRVNITK